MWSEIEAQRSKDGRDPLGSIKHSEEEYDVEIGETEDLDKFTYQSMQRRIATQKTPFPARLESPFSLKATHRARKRQTGSTGEYNNHAGNHYLPNSKRLRLLVKQEPVRTESVIESSQEFTVLNGNDDEDNDAFQSLAKEGKVMANGQGKDNTAKSSSNNDRERGDEAENQRRARIRDGKRPAVAINPMRSWSRADALDASMSEQGYQQTTQDFISPPTDTKCRSRTTSNSMPDFSQLQHQQEIIATQNSQTVVRRPLAHISLIHADSSEDWSPRDEQLFDEEHNQMLLFMVESYPDIEFDKVREIVIEKDFNADLIVNALEISTSGDPERETYISPYPALVSTLSRPRAPVHATAAKSAQIGKDTGSSSATQSSIDEDVEKSACIRTSSLHPRDLEIHEYGSKRVEMINNMAAIFDQVPRERIISALKESGWDGDAGAIRIVDLQRDLTQTDRSASARPDNYDDITMASDSDIKSCSGSNAGFDETDSVFTGFDADVGGETPPSELDTEQVVGRNNFLNDSATENIVMFVETTIQPPAQGCGEKVTFLIAGYPEPVAVQTLEQIFAFKRCFERDPERFEAGCPLALRIRVAPQILRMVLQWTDHGAVVMDPASENHLESLIQFILAATTLGLTVEDHRAIVSDAMKDILATEHDKNHFLLNTSHIAMFFSTLKDTPSLHPIRELLAKAVAREFFSHKDDSHAIRDVPVYDADAGPARRGLNGRHFRWDYELKKFPELQRMLYEIMDRTWRGRDRVEKRDARRPKGLYFADPITGAMRLVV